MTPAPRPENEQARLAVLRSLAVLDTAPEPGFDDIVLVAKALTGAKIALVSLVDADRQWFKARAGVDLCETPRDIAFCAYSILKPGVFWVDDARNDPRFSANPLVVGAPHVRLYIGAPIEVGGHQIGALCVMDDAPRPFDAETARSLAALARTTATLFASRQAEQVAARLLDATSDAILCTNEEGRIAFWNPAAQELYGCGPDEMLDKPLVELVPTWQRTQYQADLGEIHAGRRWSDSVINRYGLRKDGREFPIELSAAVWSDGAQRLTGWIVRDRTAHKAAEHALAEARTRAEAANVAKSAFLANMSHEIRTPLNGVIGLTDLLARTGLDPRQAEMAALIKSSGEQLERLLGDILDLARIEAGEMPLTSEPFPLADAVRAAFELCALKAHEKGLGMRLDIEPGADRHVRGDPVRLRQILINLLSNAVKFTHDGSVALRVRRIEDVFEFEVTDTGVGFDPALKAELFGRFQQADASYTRRFGGSGLGLAICRELVELMGGRIDCDSRPGEGATFVASLPLEAAAANVPENDPPEAPDRPLSILVADDNATNRRVIELILQSVGAEIVSAEDGAQAVEAFAAHSFDLVLMDMMMPVMNGLEATRIIRRREAAGGLARTPVLMLTANTMPEHVESALDAGADAHLTKPIVAARLLHAISAALAGTAAEDAAEESGVRRSGGSELAGGSGPP